MNRGSTKLNFRAGKPASIAVEPAFPLTGVATAVDSSKQRPTHSVGVRVRDSLVLRVVVKNPTRERKPDNEQSAR